MANLEHLKILRQASRRGTSGERRIPALQEWECFDAGTGKDSAREIREYYTPDFSQWEQPEKFKEEFEKLVRDLKKAEAAAATKSSSR